MIKTARAAGGADRGRTGGAPDTLEVAQTADDAMIAMVCVAVVSLASPPTADAKERAGASIVAQR
ncbi:MAG: hypothetical protein ACREIR_24160 [Geminicoccaceae bacterium]